MTDFQEPDDKRPASGDTPLVGGEPTTGDDQRAGDGSAYEHAPAGEAIPPIEAAPSPTEDIRATPRPILVFSDRLPMFLRDKIPWREGLVWLLLVLVVGAGFWLRSVGRNWDDYTHLHPDERFLTGVVSGINNPNNLNFENRPEASPEQQQVYCFSDRDWEDVEALSPDALSTAAQTARALTPSERQAVMDAQGKGGYFDARCSTLNPNNVGHGLYVYGQFPLFSVRVLAENMNALTGTQDWTGYNGAHIVGRAMNSVFDTLAIVLVFLIGARLAGRWPGLLAAGFYAFAAFPIQQSHFWTADAFTSFWVVLALYFGLRAVDGAGQYPARWPLLPWLASGLGLGLWEVWLSADPNALTVLLYLSALTLAGLVVTLGAEQRRYGLGVAGIGLGLAVLTVGSLWLTLSFWPLLAATGLLLALTAYWYLDGLAASSFAGGWVWLAAAYGLWIFDSMAHHGTPIATLPSLVAYLALFGLAGLLSSALRDYLQRNLNFGKALGLAGLFILLMLMAPVMGEVAASGMIAAVVLALFIGAATAGGYQDEVAFGLALGAAMAGRVNVVPLAGIIILAVLLRFLPAWDARIYATRHNPLWRMLGGLVLAGLATFLAFRTLQPHAFQGPGFFGFLQISPPFINLNPGWQQDIAAARDLVSPQADFPPAHQWADRMKWLFPLQNIVLYGLGGALGLTAVAGFIWALVRVIRGQPNWTRLALPVAWITVYFGWLGQNWVSTMRYFLPLYGVLAVLAAWALTRAFRLADEARRQHPSLGRQAVFGVAGLALIFVPVYTALYGYGFTSIHRHELTRVRASRYYQERVPADFGVWIDTTPDGLYDSRRRLVNIAVFPRDVQPEIVHLPTGDSQTVDLTPFQSVELLNVELTLAGDPTGDDDPERIQLRVWAEDPALGRLLLGSEMLETDLAAEASSPAGQAYLVPFTDVELDMSPDLERTYHLEITVLDGPVTLARQVNDPRVSYTDSHLTLTYREVDSGATRQQAANLPLPARDVQMIYYGAGSEAEYTFQAEADGVVRQVDIPHVADPFNDPDPETVRIMLSDDRSGQQASGQATGDFNTRQDGHQLFGPYVRIDLDTPFPVEAGQTYTLTVAPDDLLAITGTVVASEIPWDDPIPYKVCPLPLNQVYRNRLDTPSGLCEADALSYDPYSGYYTGLNMPLSHEDTPEKRDLMLNILNQTDYLNISSNRFYDSLSRIPTRWPMSLRYYEALFSGELGFKLVQTFESYAQVGPLVWKDQVLPTDDLPGWLNELEAEEAFHVYDHPTVFVFRKTAAYDPDKVAEILDGNFRRVTDVFGGEGFDTQPVSIMTWSGGEASASPNALQLTAVEEAIQKAGGTWSALFDREAFYNDNQVAGVLVWWLMIVVVGWLTFPLLFWIFPGLPDRGFGFAKLTGWLLVAWVAWFGGSLRIELWTQAGLRWLLVGLALLSAGLAWRQRHALRAFLRDKRDHLLLMEAITAGLFLFMIGVRLGNPDLWHQSFGGEKPMDFAYLNATLRSTIFPPLDPWFAGGHINYYYWGFVLVGAPIKALGVVPTFAYNLVVPTLFAFTGSGAFTIGYNLVAWRNARRAEHDDLPDRRPPFATAYLAGTLVMLLAVFLGNLDTPRTFGQAVARLGGWEGQPALIEERYRELVDEFQTEQGRPPSAEEIDQLRAEAEAIDEAVSFTAWSDSIQRGIEQLSNGQRLPLATHRWYWGPTRLISELPEGKGHNAIVEMPYFTFLYGDLHAHMIAMPMTLLIILFVVNEMMTAGRGIRGRGAGLAALALAAVTAGLLRATNTWDWPTYMIAGVAGLTFAAWVGQGRVASDRPPSRLYLRLRETLDLRQAVRLWPLLLAVPAAMLLHGTLYVMHDYSYEAKLVAGEIPRQCIDYDRNLDDPTVDNATLRQPSDCEGKLQPRISPASVLTWGGLGLAGAAFLYMAGLVVLGNRFDRDSLLAWLARVFGFVAISFVAVWPFVADYATPYNEILPWEQDRTPLWAYLTVHGLFLFLIASLLVWQTGRWLRRHTVADLRGLGLPVVTVLLLIPLTLLGALLAGLALDYPTFLVALPLLVWLAVLFLLPGQSQVERLVYAAAALGLGLTMGVEVIVLEGDIGRQNTVFKFYIQAWLLFSITAGVGLAWLLYAADRWAAWLRGVWYTGLAGLVSVALLYPIMATQARFLDRMNPAETPLTLDGMAYMQDAPHGEEGVSFNLNGDYHMIRWLQDNVQGTPYIIEGFLHQYRWGSRVNIYTGLPAVLGWNFHQRQQRAIDSLNNMVWNRQNNIQAFYETPEIEPAWNLIQFYDIEYIIAGTFERIVYGDIVQNPEQEGLQIGVSSGFQKFEDMVELGLLEVVYRRSVCVHPDIINVANCPPERVSEDIIYRVVAGASYTPDEPLAAQTTNAYPEPNRP